MKDLQYCGHQVYEILYHARSVMLLFISYFSSHSYTMEEYKKDFTYIHKEKKKKNQYYTASHLNEVGLATYPMDHL